MGGSAAESHSCHFRRAPAICIDNLRQSAGLGHAPALIRGPNAHGYWQLARRLPLWAEATRNGCAQKLCLLGRGGGPRGGQPERK